MLNTTFIPQIHTQQGMDTSQCYSSSSLPYGNATWEQRRSASSLDLTPNTRRRSGWASFISSTDSEHTRSESNISILNDGSSGRSSEGRHSRPRSSISVVSEMTIFQTDSFSPRTVTVSGKSDGGSGNHLDVSLDGLDTIKYIIPQSEITEYRISLSESSDDEGKRYLLHQRSPFTRMVSDDDVFPPYRSVFDNQFDHEIVAQPKYGVKENTASFSSCTPMKLTERPISSVFDDNFDGEVVAQPKHGYREELRSLSYDENLLRPLSPVHKGSVHNLFVDSHKERDCSAWSDDVVCFQDRFSNSDLDSCNTWSDETLIEGYEKRNLAMEDDIFGKARPILESDFLDRDRNHGARDHWFHQTIVDNSYPTMLDRYLMEIGDATEQKQNDKLERETWIFETITDNLPPCITTNQDLGTEEFDDISESVKMLKDPLKPQHNFEIANFPSDKSNNEEKSFDDDEWDDSVDLELDEEIVNFTRRLSCSDILSIVQSNPDFKTLGLLENDDDQTDKSTQHRSIDFVSKEDILQNKDEVCIDNIFSALKNLPDIECTEDVSDSDGEYVRVDNVPFRQQRQQGSPYSEEETIKTDDAWKVESTLYNDNDEGDEQFYIPQQRSVFDGCSNIPTNILDLMQNMQNNPISLLNNSNIRVQHDIPNFEDLPDNETVDFEFYIEVDIDSDGNIIDGSFEDEINNFDVDSYLNDDSDEEDDEDGVSFFNDENPQLRHYFPPEELRIRVSDSIPPHEVFDLKDQLQEQYNLFDQHFEDLYSTAKDDEVKDFEVIPNQSKTSELMASNSKENDDSEVVPSNDDFFTSENFQLHKHILDEERVRVLETIPQWKIINMTKQHQGRCTIFDKNFNPVSQTSCDQQEVDKQRFQDLPTTEGNIQYLQLESNPIADDFSFTLLHETVHSEQTAPSYRKVLDDRRVCVEETIPHHHIIDVMKNTRDQEDIFSKNFERVCGENEVAVGRKKLPICISFGFGHDVYLHVRCSS